MENNDEVLIKITNFFLLIGIIGIILFIIQEIFLFQYIFGVSTFDYMSLITNIFWNIMGILLYILFYIGLKNFCEKYSINVKIYNRAKRFMIFYPIFFALFSFMPVMKLFLIPNLIFLYLQIIYIISLLILAVLMLIGIIYLGIFIYKIGKQTEELIIKVGGILLIIIPSISAILLFIGFKKLIKEEMI
ncbi:MAG: hypothetical protein ACTSUG_03925 [Candidatus Helarchaeota archaeon]